MKREKIDLVFICICLLCCAALAAGMLFFGPAQARANELLTATPALMTDGGLNPRFLSDCADYLSDHFFLRQELVTAHNRMLTLLGGGTANDVIAGADGWLYYAQTLDDYTGIGAMSEAELASAARNLYLMQEYCDGQGVSFLFVPVPNKNSLYDAAMPSFGVKAAEHSAQRLIALLDDGGVRCADLFSAFRERAEVLYFRHDSHWNAKGAALAADEINRGLGRSSDYAAADFSGTAPHAGDLYEMRYPAGTDPETDCVFGGTLSYTREGSDTRPDSITINTAGGGSGGLLMFRDSFGNSLYPYLANSFASARFSRATAYNLTLAEKLDAGCVVIELVERNLRYLLRFAPVMPAPERELRAPESVSGTIALAVSGTAPAMEGYTAYCGTLPQAADDAAILLFCGNTAYEAFTGGDGSFTAYLPKDRTPELAAARINTELVAFQTIHP